MVFKIMSIALLGSTVSKAAVLSETVYVESTVDTDKNGVLDKIYVEISRAEGLENLPTIYTVSPYALGGNDVANHEVDYDVLPQDVVLDKDFRAVRRVHFLSSKVVKEVLNDAIDRGYAKVLAHSVGTGYSDGCPTVGDESETLAAKSVIDWLNGRAKAFDKSGNLVEATWASGNVGMTGVSYNGTLPNMVATTGVEGLKAIVPVAAISSWYNYYRANGLVVGPGGYIGEDADILGAYIVRRGQCQSQIRQLTRDMGRENGDFTDFWKARDYVAKASSVRAAVFIMHGQSDWNVRQGHAIEWWDALEGVVPRRMWLHRGGHGHPSRQDVSAETWAWFDHFVKGVDNNVMSKPSVEVESPSGVWGSQNKWPHEQTASNRFYFDKTHLLVATPGDAIKINFVDKGKALKLEGLIENPAVDSESRLSYLTPSITSDLLMSGTPQVQLLISILNRKAANITVAIVDYDTEGKGRIVTRGWADPQNHLDLADGAPLIPSAEYKLLFTLEPKQYVFKAGHKIGVVIASTDFGHTLRPDTGTKISLLQGVDSFIDLSLTDE